jgi:hypothetical protein
MRCPVEELEIRVRGKVDRRWSDWLGGLQISHTEDGDTLLKGMIRDQAALQGLLLRLNGLNLSLVSFTSRPIMKTDIEPANSEHTL